MATVYHTPGVYIEEIPKLPPSVAQVETAIPVFIGYTEKRGMEGTPLETETIDTIEVTEAKRITSLLEYETYFGQTPAQQFTITIEETYKNGSNQVVKRLITVNVPEPSKQTLYYHMQMYFANGGGPCYIVSVGDTSEQTISNTNLLAGLKMAKKYDEPTLIVIPQAIEIESDADDDEAYAADTYAVYKQALIDAAILQDRFVVMDCYDDNPEALRNSSTLGQDNLKYGAAYHPFLRTSVNYNYDLNDVALSNNADDTRTLAITLKKDLNDDGVFEDGDTDNRIVYSALSTELQSLVKAELDKKRVVLPPSATMVGAYAMVDRTRGVWKAPANVSLNFVAGLTKQITDEEQAGLNVDTTAGKSINAIRAFTGKGILVWGSRTLAGNDNEWRYVPVRRFFIMVEESSKKATEGFVFEPNDSNTWVRVQGMLENFLTTLWRQGALQGAKPEHAFYVAVGLNKTMTALDILEGRMIVEIGLAVVRPAEFIILRFSHKMAES